MRLANTSPPYGLINADLPSIIPVLSGDRRDRQLFLNEMLLDLLYVCRAVYTEASQLLYSANVWAFGPDFTRDLKIFLAFMQAYNPTQLQNIRKVLLVMGTESCYVSETQESLRSLTACCPGICNGFIQFMLPVDPLDLGKGLSLQHQSRLEEYVSLLRQLPWWKVRGGLRISVEEGCRGTAERYKDLKAYFQEVKKRLLEETSG